MKYVGKQSKHTLRAVMLIVYFYGPREGHVILSKVCMSNKNILAKSL